MLWFRAILIYQYGIDKLTCGLFRFNEIGSILSIVSANSSSFRQEFYGNGDERHGVSDSYRYRMPSSFHGIMLMLPSFNSEKRREEDV